MPRSLADADPALIRTSANLIPQSIDPLRIIDIVGLDKQADGGTHVLSTAEVGAVRVTGTESKGKDNKRIRLEVTEKGTPMPDHLIGLLLGAEEDWPQAFEAILGRVGTVELSDGSTHTFRSERLTHRAVRPDRLRCAPSW